MKFLIALICAAGLSGCAVLGDVEDKSADTIGDGIKGYCSNMPASERPAFKEKVEAACECKIDLTCPADVE